MIYKTDSIDKVAQALSGLQGEMDTVHKGADGYNHKYASLADVFETIRPLLKKYELSVVQPVSGSNQTIELTTMLMHSSGQYISSTVSVPVDFSNKKMNSLQAAGSTITYLRRYCLCSMLGIASADDDGKAGGESIDELRDKEPKPSSQFKAVPAKVNYSVSQEQLEYLRKQLFDRIIDENIPATTVDTWCARANVKSVSELNGEQVQQILKFINGKVFTEKAVEVES